MDTSTKEIVFDSDGVSNYYYDFIAEAQHSIFRTNSELKHDFDSLVNKIKSKCRGKYDCVLGISGGVDSTYLALIAKRAGLNPLCVHFDNGWNTETAVKNIHNIITELGFDLYTHVINWQEFKDIQLAYFKASVIDLEVPTDQFIFAALYEICSKFNVKYILSGNNFATESVLPRDWRYPAKFDLVNLRNIHKRFGTRPIRTYPRLGLFQRYYYDRLQGIRMAGLLNFMKYKKKDAKAEIAALLHWKDYGGKHFESVFTRWYQGYYLPVKFGIDKRKAHLSNLILNGEMSREEALQELAHPPYDAALQKEDCSYIAKKWEITDAEFNRIMNLAPVSHDVYGNEQDALVQFNYIVFRTLVYIPVRLGRFLKLIG